MDFLSPHPVGDSGGRWADCSNRTFAGSVGVDIDRFMFSGFTMDRVYGFIVIFEVVGLVPFKAMFSSS